MTSESAGLLLYVREGCHLCDQFLVELSMDLGPGAGQLQVVDVDRDEELASRYGLRVPVLVAEGVVLAEGAYDGAQVRRALRV